MALIVVMSAFGFGAQSGAEIAAGESTESIASQTASFDSTYYELHAEWTPLEDMVVYATGVDLLLRASLYAGEIGVVWGYSNPDTTMVILPYFEYIFVVMMFLSILNLLLDIRDEVIL